MFDQLKEELRHNEFVQFYVRARSGMSTTEVKDTLDDGSMKIHIAAEAVKGKANAELKRYLAEEFGVPKENVKMLSGASSRVKLLRICRSS